MSAGENLLTVTLSSSFDLASGEVVTISSLLGAVVAGDKLALSAVEGGNEGHFLLCSVGGEQAFGSWVDATKNLVLTVCDSKVNPEPSTLHPTP